MESRQGDEAFSSRLGLILSCMGCMVGTGNIWRFPRVIAENSNGQGCLVILMIWVAFLLLWSIPMLLIEYSIGRYTGKAVLQSFRQFLGDTAIWMGGWLTLLPLIMACWYSVVLGWCFFYTFHSIIKPLSTNHTDSRDVFHSFAADSYWPVLTHAIAVFLASASVIKGGKTIEKVNLLFVPIFLTLIAITFVWAISRDFAADGLGFLFSPDWRSFLSPRAFVDALCQNAFDTGAGMGLMVAFSAYMTRQNGIVKYATIIPCCNNLVSLICVMSIYSIVFSSLRISEPEMTQEDILAVIQDSGPASTGLTFIWMPVLFSSVGAAGRAMAVIYFLCLSFAGLTSLIAYMEVAAQTAQNLGIPRRVGVPLCFCLIFLGGLPSAMSISVLVNQDFVWAFGLVISGLMFQSLVIKYGAKKFRTIVINEYSESDWHLPRIWEWVIKFVAPLEALVALIWWAVDLIVNNVRAGVPWYQFKDRSFMATIVQWAVLMLVLGVINVTFIYCCKTRKGRGDPIEEKPLELLTDEHASLPQYGAMPDRAEP